MNRTISSMIGITIVLSLSAFVSLETESDSLDLICFFERPDALVVTDDKNVYLFFHQYFWSLYYNSSTNRLHAKDKNVTKISNIWHQLPNDINLAFTVQRTDTSNPIAGNTFFIKNNNYYRYLNQEFKDSGSIDFWDAAKWHDWRYVITLSNSSLVLLAVWPVVSFGANKGETFYFDDPNYPEHLNKFSILNDFDINLKTLKFLVPMTDQKYLAVFESFERGYYCVMETITSQCNQVPIHQIFECPADVLLTKQKNWIYWVWNTFKVNIDEALVIISGASFAVLFINLLLLTISMNRYIDII